MTKDEKFLSLKYNIGDDIVFIDKSYKRSSARSSLDFLVLPDERAAWISINNKLNTSNIIIIFVIFDIMVKSQLMLKIT